MPFLWLARILVGAGKSGGVACHCEAGMHEGHLPTRRVLRLPLAENQRTRYDGCTMGTKNSFHRADKDTSWIRLALIIILTPCVVIVGVFLLSMLSEPSPLEYKASLAVGNVNRLATSIQNYVAKRGEVPEDLAKPLQERFCFEDLIFDPFRPSSSLRYKKMGKYRFTIWSVGPDGMDQGGSPNIIHEDFGSRKAAHLAGDIAIECDVSWVWRQGTVE